MGINCQAFSENFRKIPSPSARISVKSIHRKIPMTKKLFQLLSRRHEKRDKDKPWVFWQRHLDRKKKVWVDGPYQDRNSFMRNVVQKTNVRYFRFHALRHLGTSVLDGANVNLGSIQRIRGHENRTSTFGESEREAMKVFEKAFRKSHISPIQGNKQEITGFLKISVIPCFY